MISHSGSRATELTTGVLILDREQDLYCCGCTTYTSDMNLLTFSLVMGSHSVKLIGRIVVCCPLAAATRTRISDRASIVQLEHFVELKKLLI